MPSLLCLVAALLLAILGPGAAGEGHRSPMVQQLSADELATIMGGGVLTNVCGDGSGNTKRGCSSSCGSRAATSSSSSSSSEPARLAFSPSLGGPWLVRLRMPSCFISSRPCAGVCDTDTRSDGGADGEGDEGTNTDDTASALGEEEDRRVRDEGEEETSDDDDAAAAGASLPGPFFCGAPLPEVDPLNDRSSDGSCIPPSGYSILDEREESSPLAALRHQLRAEDELLHSFAEHIFDHYDRPIVADAAQEGQPKSIGGNFVRRVALSDDPAFLRFGDFIVDSWEALVLAESLGISFGDSVLDSTIGGGVSSSGNASAADNERYFRLHYRLFNVGSGFHKSATMPSGAARDACDSHTSARGAPRTANWGVREPIEIRLSTSDPRVQRELEYWLKNPVSPLLLPLVFSELFHLENGRTPQLRAPVFHSLSRKRQRELQLLFLEDKISRLLPEAAPIPVLRHARSAAGATPAVHATTQRKLAMPTFTSVEQLRRAIAHSAVLQHPPHPLFFSPPQAEVDVDALETQADHSGDLWRRPQRTIVMRFSFWEVVDDDSTVPRAAAGAHQQKQQARTGAVDKASPPTPQKPRELRTSFLKLRTTLSQGWGGAGGSSSAAAAAAAPPAAMLAELVNQRRLLTRLRGLLAHPQFHGTLRVFVDVNPELQPTAALFGRADADAAVEAHLSSGPRLPTVEVALLPSSRTLAPHRVQLAPPRSVLRGNTSVVSMSALFELFVRFARRADAPPGAAGRGALVAAPVSLQQQHREVIQYHIAPLVAHPLRRIALASHFLSHVASVRRSIVILWVLPPPSPPHRVGPHGAMTETAERVARHFLPLRSSTRRVDSFYVQLPERSTTAASAAAATTTTTPGFEAAIASQLLRMVNRTAGAGDASMLRSPVAIVIESEAAGAGKAKKNFFIATAEPTKKSREAKNGKAAEGPSAKAVVELIANLPRLKAGGSSKNSPFVGQLPTADFIAMIDQADRSTNREVDAAAASRLHYPNPEGWITHDDVGHGETTSHEKQTKSKQKRTDATSTSTASPPRKPSSASSTTTTTKRKQASSGVEGSAERAKRKRRASRASPRSTTTASVDAEATDAPTILVPEPQRQQPMRMSPIRDVPVGWEHFTAFSQTQNHRTRASHPDLTSAMRREEKSRHSGKPPRRSKRDAMRAAVEAARFAQRDGEYVEVYEEDGF